MANDEAVISADADSRGRLVDITPFAVDPPQLGGQVVIRAVNAGLASLGYQVEQFSLGIRKTDLRALGRSSRREVAPRYTEYRRTDGLSVALFLVSAALHIPYLWAHRTLELRPWAALQTSLQNAAAVLLEMPWCYTPMRIKAQPGAPLVYVAQNAEFQLAAEWRTRWGLLGGRLADYAERCEARVLRAADFTAAITAEDAQALGERYGVASDRLHVLPRGLDLSRYVSLTPEVRELRRRQLGLHDKIVVVFAGSHHPPNLAAAAFVQDLNRQLGSGFRCIVAGSAARRLAESSTDGAWLRPGDPDPYLQVADIAVNPMTSGSGMNVKMLQYLAWGLPVVSTPWGARGISGLDGQHYCLSALEGVAAKIRSLAADPEVRHRLGDNGRQLAHSHYSAQVTAQRFADLLHDWRLQHQFPTNQAIR